MAMGRGRPRKSDPDTVLDIATRIFWDKGFEGTSMKDLADATGMAKPGLYAAFGCKEQLYVKALTHYFNQSAPMFNDLITSPEGLDVVLRRFLETIASGASDKTCPSGCFVVNSVIECANKVPSLKEAGRNLDEMRHSALIARFQMEKKRGTLSPAIDAMALASFFNGQCIALAVMGRAGNSQETLNQFIDMALKILP